MLSIAALVKEPLALVVKATALAEDENVFRCILLAIMLNVAVPPVLYLTPEMVFSPVIFKLANEPEEYVVAVVSSSTTHPK
jgi:hypothetical protein